MDSVVRVSDSRSGIFLYLADLLPVLEPEARAWTWAAVQRMPVSSLEMESDFGSLDGLRAEIQRDVYGLVMDFDGLRRFSRQVSQVIWGEFLAADSPATMPRADDSDRWVGEHVLAGLFAFDSSFWLVGGPGPVIDRVIARFRRVEEVDPREWVRDQR